MTIIANLQLSDTSQLCSNRIWRLQISQEVNFVSKHNHVRLYLSNVTVPVKGNVSHTKNAILPSIQDYYPFIIIFIIVTDDIADCRDVYGFKQQPLIRYDNLSNKRKSRIPRDFKSSWLPKHLLLYINNIICYKIFIITRSQSTWISSNRRY